MCHGRLRPNVRPRCGKQQRKKGDGPNNAPRFLAVHTQHTTCRCGVHRGLCLAGCPLVHLDLHCTFAHRASTLAKNCGVIWLACSYSFGLIWEQFVVQCLLAAGHFLVRFAHQMTRALGTFLVRWQGAHKGPRVTPRARHFLARWHKGRPVISQERKSS